MIDGRGGGGQSYVLAAAAGGGGGGGQSYVLAAAAEGGGRGGGQSARITNPEYKRIIQNEKEIQN